MEAKPGIPVNDGVAEDVVAVLTVRLAIFPELEASVVPFFWYIFIQFAPPQYSFGLAAQAIVQAPALEDAEPALIVLPQ